MKGVAIMRLCEHVQAWEKRKSDEEWNGSEEEGLAISLDAWPMHINMSLAALKLELYMSFFCVKSSSSSTF